MASKKDKLIEGAQKFIAKGQIDRAIREYEQIVAMDPEDIRQRQKLAELLVKVNEKEAAVAQYETISKQYSNKHFYLKAIAVHKQIQKLDPDNIHVTLALAGLNVKQGLIGNAMAEYSQAVNHFLKSGSLQEAIAVIEQMLAADPDNLNTRLKCAETYNAAGDRDRSYDEFSRLALFLLKRGDESAFGRVCDRVLSLFPGKADFVLDILEKQLQEGSAGVVVTSLNKLIDGDRTNLRGWKLMADAHLKNGDVAGRKATLEKIIYLFPDESFAREELIRLHLDENDIDGSLELLKANEAYFIERNSLDSVERLYDLLRKRAPGDGRVIEGLKGVYETTGDAQKLDAVTTSAKESVEEPLKPVAMESPPAPAEPLTAEPARQAEPAAEERELSWEEEIDLSLLEEEGITGFQDAGMPGTASGYQSEPAQQDQFPAAGTAGVVAEDIAAETVAEPAYDGPAAMEGDETGHSEELPQEALDLTEIEVELEDSLDFAGPELEPSISEPVAPEPEAPAAPATSEKKRKRTDQDGQFRVDDNLDKEDTETHYNLGIAYKEMCLFDEAINEFLTASMDPKRKIDCLTLQGMCYRDKGDPGRAEEVFKNILLMPGLTGEERVSLSYELAFLYETSGRTGDALDVYRKVRAEDPEFRDVAKKIALLQGGEADNEEMDLLELDAEEVE